MEKISCGLSEHKFPTFDYRGTKTHKNIIHNSWHLNRNLNAIFTKHETEMQTIQYDACSHKTVSPRTVSINYRTRAMKTGYDTTGAQHLSNHFNKGGRSTRVQKLKTNVPKQITYDSIDRGCVGFILNAQYFQTCLSSYGPNRECVTAKLYGLTKEMEQNKTNSDMKTILVMYCVKRRYNIRSAKVHGISPQSSQNEK